MSKNKYFIMIYDNDSAETYVSAAEFNELDENNISLSAEAAIEDYKSEHNFSDDDIQNIELTVIQALGNITFKKTTVFKKYDSL